MNFIVMFVLVCFVIVVWIICEYIHELFKWIDEKIMRRMKKHETKN